MTGTAHLLLMEAILAGVPDFNNGMRRACGGQQ
jgi:hypothetical protein